MSLAFKPDETYRGDYSFRNSDDAILRFPFPFPEDQYMYSVNIEPHVRSGFTPVYNNPIDVDEHYIAECRDRAITLERDPGRYQALPHMMTAQWDALEMLMECLSGDYPELFSLSKDGDRWTWTNRPLGLEQSFTFGDAATLPCDPFEYITRQVQGDFAILDQRDETLYMDAGMVTAQADWSLEFDVGMNFMEWHGPVPLAHQAGVFERALKYLLMLRQGQPVRRLNWTMTINPRLDTSPETYPEWGPDRTTITPENVGRKVHLRVELQTLFRLPRSNAILFPLRCYLISLDELVRVPKWGKRLHRVLSSLPKELVEYKGLTRFLPTALDYLKQFDDGTPTNPGCAAEVTSL
jgi:dimethylamine monooxygenase subunit A